MKFVLNDCPDGLVSLLQELEQSANAILKIEKPDLFTQTANNEVSITFINDQQIQELNLLYRQKNKPTDVLSWSFIDQELQPYELAGEIYVSIDTAKKQASEKEKPLPEHFCFLITHGLLHVFHYDHNTDQEEEKMDLITQKILSKLFQQL